MPEAANFLKSMVHPPSLPLTAKVTCSVPGAGVGISHFPQNT